MLCSIKLYTKDSGMILKMNGPHKHRLCSHMNIKICDFCPMYVVPENTETPVDEHKT